MKIALLPGDGIGPEVTAEAVRILKNVADHAGTPISFTTHAIGGVAIDAEGAGLPETTLEACLEADAVLLGAVGHPKFDGRLPSERPEAALLAPKPRELAPAFGMRAHNCEYVHRVRSAEDAPLRAID